MKFKNFLYLIKKEVALLKSILTGEFCNKIPCMFEDLIKHGIYNDDSESDTESESNTESETESETDSETDSDSDSESESENKSESTNNGNTCNENETIVFQEIGSCDDNDTSPYIIIGKEYNIFKAVFKIIDKKLIHYGFYGFNEIIKYTSQEFDLKNLEIIFFTHLLNSGCFKIIDSCKTEDNFKRCQFIFELCENKYFSIFLESRMIASTYTFVTDTLINKEFLTSDINLFKYKLYSHIKQIMNNYKYLPHYTKKELNVCDFQINKLCTVIKSTTDAYIFRSATDNNEYKQVQNEIDICINKVNTLVEVNDDLKFLREYIKNNKYMQDKDTDNITLPHNKGGFHYFTTAEKMIITKLIYLYTVCPPEFNKMKALICKE